LKTVSENSCSIFSICSSFYVSKQLRSSNPQFLTASDFAKVTLIIGLSDPLVTDSMRGENKNTPVCNIITFTKKLPSKSVYESQHVLQAIDIALQAIDFSHHNNYQQLFRPIDQATEHLLCKI